MTSDPRVEYGRRIERWNGEIARAGQAHALMAYARLVAALAIAVLAWQAFVSHRVSAIWPLVPLAAFVALAVVHVRVLRRMDRARRARQLYERGMARLGSTWAGAGPDGARFLEGHRFAHDLDLFGPASLFQLLDTARTEIGEETLAAWLGSGAEIDEVRARQVAVAELVPKIDFREDLAVLAAEAHVAKTGPLAAWAASPSAGLSFVHAAVFAASAIVSASLVVAAVMERAPWTALLAWILVQAGLVRIWRARIRTALAGIDAAAYDLGLMADLLARLEIEPFESARLAAVRAALVVQGMPPSRRVARLRRLVTFLDQATLNLWFKPIAALLLVREQTALGIDRWHAAYGLAVGTWLRAIGDVEALSALATYAYEHPADPYPAIVDSGPLFDATAIGHPLIDERVGVRNDVRLGDTHPRALIVSGSNMSGKSTLLRGVGVNVVLALAGAPVRAADLTLSPLAIGSTMRIDDSLQAGHSRFYAEILRIRTIVDLARGPRPLLFLLDEILGGTNSHDRRIGAEAIVRILIDAGAIGLVTTHDLALTELASKLGPLDVKAPGCPFEIEAPGGPLATAAPASPLVANVHFEDRIENGTMVFDYKMRPGVVERSNALALMRAVGLDV